MRYRASWVKTTCLRSGFFVLGVLCNQVLDPRSYFFFCSKSQAGVSGSRYAGSQALWLASGR